MGRVNYSYVLLILGALAAPTSATTLYVDGQSPEASDQNPGTTEAPWKTVSRAAGAKELRPGDTVFIRSGVYRENVVSFLKTSSEGNKAG